jgi:hypothetical protein
MSDCLVIILLIASNRRYTNKMEQSSIDVSKLTCVNFYDATYKNCMPG